MFGPSRNMYSSNNPRDNSLSRLKSINNSLSVNNVSKLEQLISQLTKDDFKNDQIYTKNQTLKKIVLLAQETDKFSELLTLIQTKVADAAPENIKKAITDVQVHLDGLYATHLSRTQQLNSRFFSKLIKEDETTKKAVQKDLNIDSNELITLLPGATANEVQPHVVTPQYHENSESEEDGDDDGPEYNDPAPAPALNAAPEPIDKLIDAMFGGGAASVDDNRKEERPVSVGGAGAKVESELEIKNFLRLATDCGYNIEKKEYWR
jgi:hypothetical protein